MAGVTDNSEELFAQMAQTAFLAMLTRDQQSLPVMITREHLGIQAAYLVWLAHVFYDDIGPKNIYEFCEAARDLASYVLYGEIGAQRPLWLSGAWSFRLTPNKRGRAIR